MPPPRDWNEEHQSEVPAVVLLDKLGYRYVAAEILDAERDSLREPVLTKRLGAALIKLNPWLTPENVQKAIRAVTHVAAASLIEANEKVYVALTHGVSLVQDGEGGAKGQTARFIDFERPEQNEFLVTRQYRVLGAKKQVRADVVLFVNGIPLAMIESKSPTLGGKWLDEAVRQVLRYQEIGDEYRDLGAPKLFETVQLVIGLCGQSAYYGTVATPQRFWAEWKEPYPATAEALEKRLGRKPSAQDVLVFGLLEPRNLLDLTRNFVVFEAERGRTIRKVCRYKQFSAVNRALNRVHAAKRPEERGGVIWHTQGSGKSLTMLWLALKLRRDPRLQNPAIVIVTDRTDLDRQISDTFIRCGFPNPERARSVQDLRDLLLNPTGKTVTTTIQKFQELTGAGGNSARRAQRESHPVLSEAEHIFVLVDEAHRTQYSSLAANMRRALPRACFLGFTGTPIDKQDRSTLQTFGPYIDTYTIEQAVGDDATVPIFYESRLPELRIIGNSLDKVFDHVFADRTVEEREAIKQKYATEEAIAAAPKRIEAICLDLFDHFTKFIRPNGFKAQVVAVNRETAVTYKETFDRLNGPEAAVIMTVGHNDGARFQNFKTSKQQQAELIRRFLDPNDPLAMLVVCDMLLTGFDAPIEQVMYLDSPLKEHTLLQAIARVNRKADRKTYGLVVDYWGVSDALQEALAIFSPSDVKGAMQPKVDELPRLQTRHQAALRFFARVKNRDDLDECVAVLEPEDVRAEFDQAFRVFSQSLDMLLPDPRALPYVDDLRWLGKIRGAARARYRDPGLDISDAGAKVRKLIEDVVVAEGIQLLVKEVSIFSKDFEEKIAALKSPEAKASEMEHAIRHEIHVKLEENPAFYRSLRERLEELIEERKQERIDAARQLQLFQSLIKEVRDEAGAAQRVGLNEFAYAIYGVLNEGHVPMVAEPQAPYGEEAGRELATLIQEAIEPETQIIDWTRKDDVQRQMRQKVKRHLRAANYESEKVEALAGKIVDLAKVRKGK
ncbi:type I restriction endonuclease subunit R [Corallococcus sp. CA041A]|uniref:type I restriction endonuclease subunit R n=1 Tax=Corallococcus sp. CA041A TaxID=2316727 RepID=UPI000EA00511|nr:type I restriction endonuclease subunit R [Corallococcus sp. CA041A]RKH29779.1 type I restriction endonuclease subunit R [Corallococcus sp. CA041A]